MKCDYILDISEESSSIIHTPSLLSQQMPFYIHNCGHFYADRDYYTSREGLDNYLLIYTCSGSGLIKYRNAEVTVKPSQIFVIHCLEYQCYKSVPGELWEFYWVHFNGPACRCYFNMINSDTLAVVDLPNPDVTAGILDEMTCISIDNSVAADLKMSMYMTNILTGMSLIKMTNMKKEKVYHNQIVQDVISFIQVHYARSINICDLTNMVHISEYHLIRIFKGFTGITPYEYITNYRIDKSKVLLKETELSVNEISAEVGFNNVNNYIRSFKKLVGYTPLKYRQYWIE